MAAQTRLLITPLIFASLLVGSGADTIPAAVLATTAAWLTVHALDRRLQPWLGSSTAPRRRAARDEATDSAAVPGDLLVEHARARSGAVATARPSQRVSHIEAEQLAAPAPYPTSEPSGRELQLARRSSAGSRSRKRAASRSWRGSTASSAADQAGRSYARRTGRRGSPS